MHLSGLNVERDVIEDASDMLPLTVDSDGYTGEDGLAGIGDDLTAGKQNTLKPQTTPPLPFKLRYF